MVLEFNYAKKSFVIVTGASQGIGRTLAVELSKHLCSGSTIALVARSQKGLDDTKNLLIEANKNVAVKIYPLDLTNADIKSYEQFFEAVEAEQAIIFHNAGQVGELNKTIELTDIQSWRNYFDLNVFSAGILNSIFVKKLHGVVPHLIVVNITSLCGRKPFADLAMYGTGKAAREMYFRVFALEEPDVVVLNYSPGPVGTAMLEEITKNVKDDKTKAMFAEMKETKTFLTTEQTVWKLLEILEKGEFKSGDVIDYFDQF